MNGFSIVNYARFLIDAYGDPKWNDVTIIDYINDGIRSLNNMLAAKKSNALLKTVTFNTVANQQAYKLDSSGIITANDFLRVFKLVNKNAAYGIGATVDYYATPDIPEVMAGEQHGKVYPWFYVLDGSMYIGPTPTDVNALELWYFYNLPMLTLGGTPTWMPEIYHPLLAYFAAVRMSAQDKQTTQDVKDDYAAKFQEYMEYVFGNRPNEIQYLPAGDAWRY